MSGYKNLTQRALNISDSSTSSDGSKVYSTTSYTTSKSSPPPHDPEDSAYAASVRTHTVGDSHPIVRLWEATLRNQVMSKVQALGDEWQAVDVVRRGWSIKASENEVTVVVTVAENERKDEWADLILKLKHLCSQTCGLEVEAELVTGQVSRGADNINWIGSPIGEANTKGTGTLGGYFKLRKDGREMLVAVTCHHVLCSNEDGEQATTATATFGRLQLTCRKRNHP